MFQLSTRGDLNFLTLFKFFLNCPRLVFPLEVRSDPPVICRIRDHRFHPIEESGAVPLGSRRLGRNSVHQGVEGKKRMVGTQLPEGELIEELLDGAYRQETG